MHSHRGAWEGEHITGTLINAKSVTVQPPSVVAPAQGGKCELMPNRMFKHRVAQGCAETVKCKWLFFNAEMV